MGTGLPTFRRGDSWSDQDSHQFNRLVDEVRGGMVTSVGPGLRMTRVPPFGTSIGLEPKLAKKIEAAAAATARFYIVRVMDDVVIGWPVADNGALGIGDDPNDAIRIAKRPYLRIQTDWTIDTSHGYTIVATGDQSMTVSQGTIIEKWVTHPPYVSNASGVNPNVGIITAIKLGTKIELGLNDHGLPPPDDTVPGRQVCEWEDIGMRFWRLIE
jgi:hypothetical protein